MIPSLPLGIPADPSFEATSEDDAAPARHMLACERIARRLGIDLKNYCAGRLGVAFGRLSLRGVNQLLDLLESELQKQARAA